MKNVLFVDDNEYVLNAIRRSVSKEPWCSIYALSAKEALKIIQDEDISVLVTDISMPMMDGIELMKATHKLSPDSILVALTGKDDIEEVYRIFEQVAIYKYITKPWEPRMLNEIIREALRECVQ